MKLKLQSYVAGARVLVCPAKSDPDEGDYSDAVQLYNDVPDDHEIDIKTPLEGVTTLFIRMRHPHIDLSGGNGGLEWYQKICTIVLFILLNSCDYTEKTKQTLRSMPEPITLIYKEKMTLWYSVILKDGQGKTYRFGNVSSLARTIGENYSINDTIPKQSWQK
jgi:hypothetical protein